MSVADQCGNVCFVASGTRVNKPGVRGRRRCQLPFYGCISGGGTTARASPLAGARMDGRPGASWKTASSMKAGKATTSREHPVVRAPKHGEGRGIEWKLMARPLAPPCVTIYGHLDALAIVLLTQPCMTVHGVHNI